MGPRSPSPAFRSVGLAPAPAGFSAASGGRHDTADSTKTVRTRERPDFTRASMAFKGEGKKEKGERKKGKGKRGKEKGERKKGREKGEGECVRGKRVREGGSSLGILQVIRVLGLGSDVLSRSPLHL